MHAMIYAPFTQLMQGREYIEWLLYNSVRLQFESITEGLKSVIPIDCLCRMAPQSMSFTDIPGRTPAQSKSSAHLSSHILPLAKLTPARSPPSG